MFGIKSYLRQGGLKFVHVINGYNIGSTTVTSYMAAITLLALW